MNGRNLIRSIKTISKAVHSISYFPTNPLPFSIPERYHFLSLKECEGSFGTVIKSADQSGYLLRIYNNEEKEVKAGTLNINLENAKFYKTNLLETKLETTTSQLDQFKPEELRNIKIVND